MQTVSDFFIYFVLIGILTIYFLMKEDKKKIFKNKDIAEEKKVASFSNKENISSFPPLEKNQEELKEKGRIKKHSFKSKIKARNLKEAIVLAEIFKRPYL